MATTTNFGWETPDDTDLVKDGAAAIRTALGGVDTSFVDLKGGTTGQVLSKASNTDLDYTWVTTDDANAIQNAIVDAKGDLIAATANDTPARLAVGNNGETLVADSSTATGLRYQTGVSTNSIINGGMDIWQRGTTFTNPTVANYTADRFMINRSGDASGATVSRTTSTPTGFLYAMQWQRTAGNTGTQSMEIYYGLESNDSYRFAGQTATLSFYAKKGANYSGGNLNFQIASGTGTDAKPYAYSTTVASTSATLTTSYQRFSVTGTFASNITQAFFNVSWVPTGTAGADDSVYITGIQLELGSVATTFKRVGGSIQGELAACQRYYHRFTGGGSSDSLIGSGLGFSTTVAMFVWHLGTTMRIAPSSMDLSNQGIYRPTNATAYSGGTWSLNQAFDNSVRVIYTHGSAIFTAGESLIPSSTNATNFIGFSAEL